MEVEVQMDREKEKLGFEETELRLGLPGARKRNFSNSMDLKLHISSESHKSHKEKEKNNNISQADHSLLNPPAKSQVVGWPPVRSFRKNMVAVQKSSSGEEKSGAGLVKVSMDGAPYLRKVDLRTYKNYQNLSDALANMFSSFTIGNCGSEGIMKDYMNESKIMDVLNGSEYVPTYEDKDGDWMLVGDVPWEMFVKSCKRLRIMKGKEAIGLAPKAMEKCKNRS